MAKVSALSNEAIIVANSKSTSSNASTSTGSYE